jgi:hypothetical protein
MSAEAFDYPSNDTDPLIEGRSTNGVTGVGVDSSSTNGHASGGSGGSNGNGNNDNNGTCIRMRKKMGRTIHQLPPENTVSPW